MRVWSLPFVSSALLDPNVPSAQGKFKQEENDEVATHIRPNGRYGTPSYYAAFVGYFDGDVFLAFDNEDLERTSKYQ
jgi:hypothetical protein